MPGNVLFAFVFCWTAFVLGVLFAFSPEIKRIIFKKDMVEFERYKQKVDKALVEYDEFKKTIYPLLEFSLGQLVGNRYMSSAPKTEVLLDYLPRVRRMIDEQNYKDSRILDLYEVVKSITLEQFATELNLIAVHGLQISGDSKVLDMIRTGLASDYSLHELVDKDEIWIDFDGLSQYEEKLSGSYKGRFHRKLESLRKFYNQYF